MIITSNDEKYNLVINTIEGTFNYPSYKGIQKFRLMVFDIKKRVFIRRLCITFNSRTGGCEHTLDGGVFGTTEPIAKETLSNIISLFNFDLTELLFSDSEKLRLIGKLLQESNI